MTFTHDGANNAEIIKSVSYFKDTYSIEYFNGDTSTYYCNNIEELKRLKKIMLEQAKERQNAYNLDNLSFYNKIFLYF